MRWLSLGMLASTVSLSTMANAGELPILAPAPPWVKPVGALSAQALSQDGLILMDRQLRVEGDRVWSYVDYAIRASSPEQMQAIGGFQLAWHPDKGDVTVHKIEIIRNSTVIPVMVTAKDFSVLRREQSLEQFAINGVLTASYQIPGLQTGDTVRYAFMIDFRDSAMGNHALWSMPQFIEPAKISIANLRLSLPENGEVRWRSSVPTAMPTISKSNNRTEILFAEPIGKPPEMPADAPLRFRAPPFVELSSFADWPSVSKQGEVLYRPGREIDQGSDLANRITQIEKQSSDPLVRAAKALRLVQDEIRYLFNGQAQGNFIPQSAKETWDKKYGDCKAKTLLLLALLDRLGIKAEAALVHSTQGDLLESRLPSFNTFDHVIVRAEIGGVTYWLDGTQNGGRLDTLIENPNFKRALPLRTNGSALEPIPLRLSRLVHESEDLELDASAGLGFPKLFKFYSTVRGPVVGQMKLALGGLDAKSRREMVEAVISGSVEDALVATHNISIDDETGIARIEGSGITNLSWEWLEGKRQATLYTMLDDFTPEADRARAAWSDIPVVVPSDQAATKSVRIKLPKSVNPFSLSSDEDINEQLWGVRFNRKASLASGLVTINESVAPEKSEIAAKDLPLERQKRARLASRQIKIIAPEGFPLKWQEYKSARKEGRLKALDAAYAAYIAKDPKDVHGYMNRAAFHIGLNEKPQAMADLNKIISIEPDADSYLKRAKLHPKSSISLALADIEEAQKIDPASDKTVRILVELLNRNGKFSDSLAAIDKVEPLLENKYDLIDDRAETLVRAGRKDEALALLAAAMKDKPGNATLLNNSCWTKGLADLDLAIALKECSKSIELSEEPTGQLHSRALVYFRMKRYDESMADIEAAEKMGSASANFYYLRGIVSSWMGNQVKALADIETAKYLNEHITEVYDAAGIKPKT